MPEQAVSISMPYLDTYTKNSVRSYGDELGQSNWEKYHESVFCPRAESRSKKGTRCAYDTGVTAGMTTPTRGNLRWVSLGKLQAASWTTSTTNTAPQQYFKGGDKVVICFVYSSFPKGNELGAYQKLHSS